MHGGVVVDMCVGVREECPVSYLITVDQQIEFTFGGPRGGYHWAFDAKSLRSFLQVGADALAEMETHVESSSAEQEGRIPVAPRQAAEHSA